MIGYYKDSRDLCDDLVENGYTPSWGGWYKSKNGNISIGFFDENFKTVHVQTSKALHENVPVEDFEVTDSGTVWLPDYLT